MAESQLSFCEIFMDGRFMLEVSVPCGTHTSERFGEGKGQHNLAYMRKKSLPTSCANWKNQHGAGKKTRPPKAVVNKMKRELTKWANTVRS
jgi:hypothetical protein